MTWNTLRELAEVLEVLRWRSAKLFVVMTMMIPRLARSLQQTFGRKPEIAISFFQPPAFWGISANDGDGLTINARDGHHILVSLVLAAITNELHCCSPQIAFSQTKDLVVLWIVP
jgi:hypothetical protein